MSGRRHNRQTTDEDESSSGRRNRQRTNSDELTPHPHQSTRGSGTGTERRVTTAATGRQGQSNDGSTPANFADLNQQDPPSIPNRNRNRRWSLEPALNPPDLGRGDLPSDNNGGVASALLNAAAGEEGAPPPPLLPPQQQQQQQQQQEEGGEEEEVDPSIVIDTYNAGQPLNFDLSSTIVDIDDDVDGSYAFAIKLENVRRTQLYTNGALLLAINDKPLHEICASMGGINMNQDRHTKQRVIECLLSGGVRPLTLKIKKNSTTAPTNQVPDGQLPFGQPVRVKLSRDTTTNQRTTRSQAHRRKLGVVRRRLSNGTYEIQYQEKEYLPNETKNIEDLEVSWDNYLPTDLGEVPPPIQRDDKWYGKNVKRDKDPAEKHDPRWNNCRVRSLIDDGFNIAEALKHHAPNGEVAAATYTNLVLNEGSKEGQFGNATFEDTQAEVYGHTYHHLQKSYENGPDDVGGKCTCKGCTARFRYFANNSITTITNKHSPSCMMKHFLQMPEFTREQKERVVIEYVRRVETIVDTDGKLGCEVWYFFDYHKTYMSYDQIYKAIRAAHDDDAEKTIRLLKRGNNTAGGMIIDPDKYYLISTYGRLACVTNTGEMKLVGTITQEQYTRVVLNCIDQGTLVKQDISFPLADLVQKHFDSLDGKPIDMVNFVTDHRNFRRRDNHIRNLFKNTHRGNCKRKKSNTLLEPRGDGWHPFHAGHGINTNHGYCWICQSQPSDAEDNPTEVNCTGCRFSFHRECINPPLEVEVTPDNWRCWCCMLEDRDLSQAERDQAENNWRDMLNPT